MIRPKWPEGYKIVGPTYHTVGYIDGRYRHWVDWREPYGPWQPNEEPK